MTALRHSRRRLLQLLGVGLAASVAGCQSGSDETTTQSPETTLTPTATPEPTATPSPTPEPPESGQLVAGTATKGAAFGHAVALDGQTALIGAFGVDADSGVEDVGSAFVFSLSS